MPGLFLKEGELMKFDAIILRNDIENETVIKDFKQISFTRGRVIISSDDANEVILTGFIESMHIVREGDEVNG